MAGLESGLESGLEYGLESGLDSITAEYSRTVWPATTVPLMRLGEECIMTITSHFLWNHGLPHYSTCKHDRIKVAAHTYMYYHQNITCSVYMH